LTVILGGVGGSFGSIAKATTLGRRDAIEVLLQGLREAFAREQTSAALGSCMQLPSEGIVAAWKKADQAMYDEKRTLK
jgi:hypothetical protein